MSKIIENKKIAELMDYARKNKQCEWLGKIYDIKRNFPDLKDFRLGPCMIDRINLDWVILDNMGHAMMARICWDGTIKNLPLGWQDTTCRSYLDTDKNTIVGMFVFINEEYRNRGYAEIIVKDMISFAKHKFKYFIIPLLLPGRYKKENLHMSYDEFAFKKKDREYEDYWLKLHTKLGGEILCTSLMSHQHAMNIRDFGILFNFYPTTTGEFYFEKNKKWYVAYANIEHNIVCINEACVWVKHNL